jgi:ATP-binding cassette subfamily A (ABC1) protein 3
LKDSDVASSTFSLPEVEDRSFNSNTPSILMLTYTIARYFRSCSCSNFRETFDPAYKFVWADATTSQTSPSPVDIINRITSGFSDKQLSAVHRVETANDVPASCPQNFNQFSECFAAVVFYDVQSGSNIKGFNYTIRADGGLAYINVEKHTSDLELRILPLQWALDEAIITLSGGSSGAFNPPQEWPFTQMTNEEQTREIRLGYVRAVRELFVLAL